MATFSAELLRREAAALGFRPDTLEKVARLLDLLEIIRRDRFLQGRLVLKGGTALNLFLFDVPRLSVDIDLNYIGGADVETMRAERPRIEDTLQRIASRAGLQVRHVPTSHAGGKWVLPYRNALGSRDEIQIDLNYLLRVPLWDPIPLDSRPLGPFHATSVPVLDEHELAAGKLIALLTRTASRDLYDAHHLLTDQALDPERLRLATVVYGAMSPTDFRKVTPDVLDVDARDLEAKLIPVLRAGPAEEARTTPHWGARLLEECREALAGVLPLRENEREFLTRLRDHGEICGDLLTSDADLIRRINSQPALHWRVLRRGSPAAAEQDPE